MLKKRYATQYHSALRAKWVCEDFRCAEMVAIVANYLATPGSWVEVAMIHDSKQEGANGNQR